MRDSTLASFEAVSQSADQPQYLTDYSPRDKPWDVHRAQAQTVEGVYSGTVFDALAGRIRDCTGYLGFVWSDPDPETGELHLRLRSAHFCRVRHCPVCQWRRSLMWQARFLKALPAIEAEYTSARWLFLTLTVRNCPITELRHTIQKMNKAWNRFVQRREFDSNTLGWIRTTEVTRGRDDSAHPHFHVLMMVKPSYFGKNYVTQRRWTGIWQECARLDYTPIVHVKAVKPKSQLSGLSELPLRRAISETLKYSVKPSDMKDDWLIELTRQVYHLRFVASGGVLKDVLREGEESEKDLLLADDPTGDDASEPDVFFKWHRGIKRYVKR